MEKTNTVIVGGGQAGLAASAHLKTHNIEHVIFERGAVAENWQSARWDSLVMNGPAWHDRFPTLEFYGHKPDSFPSKSAVVEYFKKFAEINQLPIRCNVEVRSTKPDDHDGYIVQTSSGKIHAKNIVVATGPFQEPIFPKIVPDEFVTQIHSRHYKNPTHLEEGAVLVIGSGSSGAQIADELQQVGRQVYLSIGPHERPPRSYRGKDYCWWLGALGKWQAKTPVKGKEHVTIAVSGANGGKTVDFREFAYRGIKLLGTTNKFQNGVIYFANDLKQNILAGDNYYLELLQEADAHVEQNKLDFPEEKNAKEILSDPDCMLHPSLRLSLKSSGINSIIWATGYKQSFNWLKVDCFNANGQPDHKNGVGRAKGIYFLGLPWLSMRGSSFIWGVWEDADYISKTIARRNN
jgi:putative flavoprotein involved in K+ transport